MTTKPATSDGYDLATTQFTKATCLYVATKLGDLMDSVVVSGGLVPTLLIPQARAPPSPRHTSARWISTWD